MKEITHEMLQKVKTAGSVAELIAIAEENGVEMTEEEAKNYYAQLNPSSGELSDDELDNVAGGGCHKGDGRLVVTSLYHCGNFACKLCGKGCVHNHTAADGIGSKQIDPACVWCQYCSVEKGLWLCNHPANRK